MRRLLSVLILIPLPGLVASLSFPPLSAPADTGSPVTMGAVPAASTVSAASISSSVQPVGSAAARSADWQSQRPDSADLRRRAERLQSRFERLRRRALPPSRGSSTFGDCDEIVGRFCLVFGGASRWVPIPDSPEVLQARGDLLDSLTAFASAIPGDEWVVAQLVQYLGEEGRWSEALSWVSDCSAREGRVGESPEREAGDDGPGRPGARPETRPVSTFARALPGWWCHALRGLVLHRSDRYGEAEASFRQAIERMHPDRRERWEDPDALLERRADDVWDDADVAERETLRERLWALSDPLYLVGGNDRLTEHWARHAVAWVREDAENPYGLSWAWDLERLVVRYGEEMGWDRIRSPASSLRPDNVVGHHHPESRPFLPPGAALGDPAGFEEAEWEPEGDHPVTAYAPPYAPDLRFEPFQLARFRRGDEMVVVAGYRLPPDTTAAEVSGRADGEVPRSAARPASPADVRAGLFLVDPDRGGAAPEEGHRVVRQARRAEGSRGALALRVPMAPYLASVEVWSPSLARAGRLRRGVGLTPLAPDVAAISDLLLLDPADPAAADPEPPDGPRNEAVSPPSRGGLPSDLESALPLVRPLLEMCVGETIGVGWELTGIGLRREVVEFAFRMETTGRGFFARVGDFLGLTERPEPLTLAWSEPGPERLEPFFRAVALSVPSEMEPGEYRLSLEARLQGRAPLEASLGILLREREACPRRSAETSSVDAPAGRF